MHNAWPTLWAEVNAKAVASRDKTGEALFFMRAGFTGGAGPLPASLGGDQSVDFRGMTALSPSSAARCLPDCW